MTGMPMPGGESMASVWMPMAGQPWLAAAISFLGMWAVMMAAMMLPSLAPALWRLRQALAGSGASRPGWLTALAGVAYLSVWTLCGAAVYPLGAARAAAEMQQPLVARAVPFAVGVVVLLAGALQRSAWKARELACCRRALREATTALATNAADAIRHGMRLGLHCTYCCAALVAILPAIGVMDLRAMTLVTAAITVERLLPSGERIAKAIGTLIVAFGLVLVARATLALG